MEFSSGMLRNARNVFYEIADVQYAFGVAFHHIAVVLTPDGISDDLFHKEIPSIGSLRRTRSARMVRSKTTSFGGRDVPEASAEKRPWQLIQFKRLLKRTDGDR